MKKNLFLLMLLSLQTSFFIPADRPHSGSSACGSLGSSRDSFGSFRVSVNSEEEVALGAGAFGLWMGIEPSTSIKACKVSPPRYFRRAVEETMAQAPHLASAGLNLVVNRQDTRPRRMGFYMAPARAVEQVSAKKSWWCCK